MNAKLALYVEQLVRAFATIQKSRQDKLEELAAFVRERRTANEDAKLVFICTHNSRRSHFAQLWAATAAAYYGVDRIATFSGGTEATAFNPRAVAAIERAGFGVEKPGGENPRYRVFYDSEGPLLECFSKRYDHPANPRDGFAAVMTCSEADAACPHVAGAALRLPIAYDDPKAADDTPAEAATYDERCRQIGTELFYVLSRVRGRLGARSAENRSLGHICGAPQKTA